MHEVTAVRMAPLDAWPEGEQRYEFRGRMQRAAQRGAGVDFRARARVLPWDITDEELEATGESGGYASYPKDLGE